MRYKIENGKLMQAVSIKKDIGLCYFCSEPVLASEGQLIKYRRGYPTHKACRKGKTRS